MPVGNATSTRPVKTLSLDAAPFVPSSTSVSSSPKLDEFSGTTKGSSKAAGFNPFDPFGVAQFWMQNNPITLTQNLMLAAQVYSRGPFGGPFYMGPFY